MGSWLQYWKMTSRKSEDRTLEILETMDGALTEVTARMGSQAVFCSAASEILEDTTTMTRLLKEAEENVGHRRRSRSNRADGRRAENPKGKGRANLGRLKGRHAGQTAARQIAAALHLAAARVEEAALEGATEEMPRHLKLHLHDLVTHERRHRRLGRIGDRTLYHHCRDKTEKISICRNFNQRGACSENKKSYCRYAHECAWCFKKDAPVIKCNCS